MNDDDTRTAERERPTPPRLADGICDICGKSEHDCRRTPPSVSSHTYEKRDRLTTQEDPRPPLPRPVKRYHSPLSRRSEQETEPSS